MCPRSADTTDGCRDGSAASSSERCRRRQSARLSPAEASVLAAIAGVRPAEEPASLIQWEGARYRVDPAGAELRRLWRVRERQGGLSLDAALAAGADAEC